MSLKNLLDIIQNEITPTQKHYIQVVIDCNGNKQAAAQKLGVSRTAVRSAITGAEKKGAKKGYSPDHGLNHAAPEGFQMSGYSHMRKDEDGKLIGWDKYTASKENMQDMLNITLDTMRESIPKSPKVKISSKNSNDQLVNTYIITDYHLGMLSWEAETGVDWDIDIAEDLLVTWFAKAIEKAPVADTAIFAQLGDFLHFDSLEAVTPSSGHLLDADTRFQKLVRSALRVIRRIVTMLLEKYKTLTILMAEGNHDIVSSLWLREVFAMYYDSEPRVTVDNSVDPYYVYEHGLTSIFFHHGHKRKVANIDSVFVAKYREIFGRTKFSYAHMGHLHHVDMKETNLMVVEQHRTLAAPDAYAARGGWMSGRESSVITYHKKFGYISRITMTPEAAMSDEF